MTSRTDNFNRADSSNAIGTPSDAGSAWSQLSGAWGISGNQAWESLGATTNVVCVLDSATSDVDIQVTIATLSENAGAVARAADDNNYLLAAVNPTGIVLYKRVAGSFTQIGSFSGAMASGDVIKFSANGTTLNVYQNGTLRIGPITESAGSTNTKHGLQSFADVTSRYEDFSITDIGGSSSVTGSGDSIVDDFTSDASGEAGSGVTGTGDSSVGDFVSAASGTASGTITTEPLKNNTGTVLASETGATVYVYDVSDGSLVVTKTGQTTDASGIMTIADALIVSGTEYRVVIVLSSGAEGMDRITAT